MARFYAGRSQYERLLAPANLVDFLQASPLAHAFADESAERVEDLFERPRDLGRDIEL